MSAYARIRRSQMVLAVLALSLAAAWLLVSVRPNLVAAELLTATTVGSLPAAHLRLASASPGLARLIARLYLASGRSAEAVPWLEIGTSGPAAPLAYFDLCVLHWQAEEMDGAVQDCRAGRVPATYWVRRGLDLETEADYAGALRAYLMAILLDPKSAGRQLLGFVAEHTEPEQLVAVLSPFVERHPGACDMAYVVLGGGFWHLGQRDRAFGVMLDGFRRFPASYDLASVIAYYYRLQGTSQEVAHWFDVCLQLRPDDPNALAGRAEAALRLSDPTTAVTLYERALRLRPSEFKLWYGLGLAQKAAGQRDLALAAFEQALALDPESVAASLQVDELR